MEHRSPASYCGTNIASLLYRSIGQFSRQYVNSWAGGICILTLSLLTASVSSQPQDNLKAPRPYFEVFELPGGITGNQVQMIAQDSLGFMWFASQNGLHRYDGRRFLTYQYDPLDENSPADNYIEWIHIDRRGVLWLAHYGSGLSVFNPLTGKFSRYRYDPMDSNSLSSDTLSVIAEDWNGNIWIGTNLGLNRFDPHTGKSKRFVFQPDNPRSLSHNKVRAVYVDRKGTLWVGCGFPWDDEPSGGLNRFHPETESFTRYFHDPENTG